MGPLAIFPSQPTSANTPTDNNVPAAALAELNDADYVMQVLQPGSRTSEQEIEEELARRAGSLGIAIRPHTPIHHTTAGAESDAADLFSHVRNTSTSTDSNHTDHTIDTILTIPSSPVPAACLRPPVNDNLPPSPKARARCLTFSMYDKYLAQVEPNLDQTKFLKQTGATAEAGPTSIFKVGVGTRKSVVSIKNGIKARVRWKKRASMPSATISCVCCRDEFGKQEDLRTLPCGHIYCDECLQVMVNQAQTDESKMPPRCCTQPIPGSIIKVLLSSREDQQLFLKAVQVFSTPWEARIFCPTPNCNEFIPPRTKVDPKHPFDTVCRECRTRVCTMCKMRAHPLGQDCPSDLELDQVLRMGEKSGWRRCYKCRTLVELTQGCTHMTCRCKAQFCYICGAIWDPTIGCPNFCNGEEELERRRLEEAEREAEEEAEKAAREAAAVAAELERQAAERRTEASAEFKALKAEQEAQMQRFLAFEKKTKWKLWARHHQRKMALNAKYSDQTEKMRERHAKTEQHLEERQIAAEIELRASLEQAEKSVRIRVKHMEAYCKALGRSSAVSGGGGGGGGDANMPPRVVTERHLRELGQQHNALEGMARLHQARINVLRDRQAKRMEELLERQEKELEKLDERREEDIEDLAAEFAHEEDALAQVFEDRRARLVRRWQLAVEILRVEMEKAKGETYAPIAMPEWPAETPSMMPGLSDGAVPDAVVEDKTEGIGGDEDGAGEVNGMKK